MPTTKEAISLARLQPQAHRMKGAQCFAKGAGVMFYALDPLLLAMLPQQFLILLPHPLSAFCIMAVLHG